MEKLDRGGLPLVLSQTFRAIIHSRMKVGMEKYATRYPDADILLFEPAREDVDMFFAKIFSYAQRRKLCALAFDSTRDYLREHAPRLAPLLARHGLRLRSDRIADREREVDRRGHRSAPAACREPRAGTACAGSVATSTTR